MFTSSSGASYHRGMLCENCGNHVVLAYVHRLWVCGRCALRFCIAEQESGSMEAEEVKYFQVQAQNQKGKVNG